MILTLVVAGCSGKTATYEPSAPIGKQINNTIIGIEPGSGEMQLVEKKVMKDYGLNHWNLEAGSESTMTASLDNAIRNRAPIIITGWTPHWIFQKYNLKYLKDPKGVFGAGESIHTIVHKGYTDEDPNATKLLDQFYWTPNDIERVMLDIQNGIEPGEAARKWVTANADKVSKWTKGVHKVNGKKMTLGYVAWSSEVASTHVVAAILGDLGYKVNLELLAAGPMWAGVAQGSIDAIVSAWLPTTQDVYFKQFKDRVTDLGPNFRGTKMGLVVPSYVKINSIDDLEK